MLIDRERASLKLMKLKKINYLDLMSANLNFFGIGQGKRPATETLSPDLTTRLDQSIYNNLNQLVNLNSGGPLRFSGDTSKAMTSVNIATPVVSISANPQNSIFAPTTYLASATAPSGYASSTMWVDMPQASNGITTATINGNSVTANIVMSITVYNANLANGQEVVSYTVTNSDTFATIANALTNLLNNDTKLAAIGFVASTSNATINLSINQPSYSASLSTGATETVTFGYNNLGNTQLTVSGKVTSGDVITVTVTDAYLSNGQTSVSYTVQANDTLTTIATGIASAISASSALSAIGISASNNANVAFTGQNFNTSLPVASASSLVTITGADAANNKVNNNVAISSIGQNNANTTFDLNGNMTSDGINTYQYDAENRLVQINYPGTGNNTQIFYDGLGHWVKSIETTNNATTSVIQYLWSGDNLIEERDASGSVLRRFFSLGEQINGSNYYYVKGHLGSIRQMTDSSGNLVYQADYTAYGQATVSINTVTPAFGYAGYFVHGRSSLNLTVHRAYSANLARFLNRDPIGESGGINLYGCVGGDPVDLSDTSGLGSSSSNSCKKKPKNNRPIVIPFMWDSFPRYPTINDIPGGVPGAETLDGYPLAPPGVSLEENGRMARSNFLDFLWLISQVYTGQPWDYKNTIAPQYANFGNFNFGYTAAVIGLPLDIALRGAGAYQEFFQTQNYLPEFGHFYLTPPYGDDPMDEDYIVRGWHYFYVHGLK